MQRIQAASRQTYEIRLPAPARIFLEVLASAGVLLQKLSTDFIANFEMLWRDCRPQPSAQLTTSHTHLGDGALEHPRSKPAPSRMSGSDARAIPRGKQHRQAIRDHHHASDAH